METEAEKYFKQIDELGGVIPAIKQNFFQKEIAQSAYNYQRKFENKEQITVGVNEFISEKKHEVEILKVADEYHIKQNAKLTTVKTDRDSELVKKLLGIIEEKAKTNENLLPFILDAVRAYASVGEIIQALKNVYGHLS